MGIIHVTTEVCSLNRRDKRYLADFLVDASATDCMAPASRLKSAGVMVEGKAVHEGADGKAIESHYGFARFSFMGDETVAPVIFGPESSEPVLGTIALESTGVVVDPKTRTLRRLHAKPLKPTRR